MGLPHSPDNSSERNYFSRYTSYQEFLGGNSAVVLADSVALMRARVAAGRLAVRLPIYKARLFKYCT